MKQLKKYNSSESTSIPTPSPMPHSTSNTPPTSVPQTTSHETAPSVPSSTPSTPPTSVCQTSQKPDSPVPSSSSKTNPTSVPRTTSHETAPPLPSSTPSTPPTSVCQTSQKPDSPVPSSSSKTNPTSVPQTTSHETAPPLPSSTPSTPPTSVCQTSQKPDSPVPSSTSETHPTSVPQTTSHKPHLKNVLSGKGNSWRFDVFTGKSREVKRKDLAYNVHFGCFPEDHVDDLLDLLQEHFPHQTSDCKLNILLPECLIKIVQNCLHMTYPEAESYLKNSNEDKVEDFIEQQRTNTKKRKSGHACSSVPKRTKKGHHITISQGLPESVKNSFTASCPEFTLTPQGRLLIEMIVNGKIKFEGDQNVSTDDLKSLSGFKCKNNKEKWLTNFTIEAHLKLIKLVSTAQGRNVDFFKSEEFEKKDLEVLLKGKGNPLDQDFIFIPLLHANH